MINVLIVDDSDTEVELLRRIIGGDPDFSVIGVAKNGKQAIDLANLLKPDLITMDIQMPIMDGLKATRQIMAQNPTPIVVISSTVNDNSMNATYPILEAGALSALAKPWNIFSPDFKKTQAYILETLKSMAEIKVARKRLKTSLMHDSKTSFRDVPHKAVRGSIYELIAIGVSVGGPLALKTIFKNLPANFSLPIVVVQHMALGFISGYVKWLSSITELQVKEAKHLEVLKGETIYVAPDGCHFEVDRIMGKLHVKLVQAEPVDGFCPSITVLMNSVAKSCRRKAIGVLLTGMGFDGATGLLAIKKADGHTCIQDPESAVVFGMAGVAQSLGAVDDVVPLEQIASYLVKLCN